MTNIPLVLLFGILSSIQVHLAKALERQGIEALEQLKAKLQRSGRPAEGGLRKPVIYTVGVVLNNTLFIWALLAQPYGPPALFSSMFGVGLVFLMFYAALVLKEPITRREAAGSIAIVAGTLVIGIENIQRAGMDRFTMRLVPLLVALGIWFTFNLVFVFASLRAADLRAAAIAIGLLAGGLGSLDPFFKGVGQNYGGVPGILPSNWVGGLFFGLSFLIGFSAFVVTQIGFLKKARASLLVPAYNAAYIGLPVIWQALLLPDYRIRVITAVGLLFILAGVVALQAFGRVSRIPETVSA